MNENMPFDDMDDDLDARLADIASGDSFITKAQRKQKERPQLDDMSFAADFIKNWWMYALLLLSAGFTGTLGFFLGLAPTKTLTGILFNDDGLHIFLALIYCITFIAVTEFAFGLGKWLYFTREQKNNTQSIVMVVWMIVAGISILLTGIAGGSVIASFIGFMTEFVNIDPRSQQWIVKAIPILFFFYAGLGTVYILSSRENAAKRMVKEQQRDANLAHETRLLIAKQWGREQVFKTEIKKYMRAVEQGVMTRVEADHAIDEGLSLQEMEQKLRRDLDGDGTVGMAGKNGKRPQPAYGKDVEVIPELDPTKNGRSR